MSIVKRLTFSVVALVFCAVFAAGVGLAQEVDGGASAGVSARKGPAALVDPQELQPGLYLLVAGAVVVAGVTTVLLAMGRGEMKGRRKLSEGERRMGRMFGESQTEYQTGRRRKEEPEQTQ